MRKRGTKQHRPTVWRALNEPVVEVTEETARKIVAAALLIILFAWLAPHFVSASLYGAGLRSYEVSEGKKFVVYEVASLHKVAGATSFSDRAPEWYYGIKTLPGEVAGAFAQGAHEVLDLSEPVAQVVEFYEPGVDALWNAWLELMADPY